MGSITDCCVADDIQRVRIENEGSRDIETRTEEEESLPTDHATQNPSIYAKQPDLDTKFTPQIAQPLVRKPLVRKPSPKNPESEPQTEVQRPTFTAPSVTVDPEPQTETETITQITGPTPSDPQTVPSLTVSADEQSESVAVEANAMSKRKGNRTSNGFKIVVTQPLSPTYKLQRAKSFWEDDHPYSQHKQRLRVLSNGYIRRYNTTATTSFPVAIRGLIFGFYYFHYADYQSQMSVLNDTQKKKQSIALTTNDKNKDDNLAEFLSTILNSKLADKLWKKFDSDLKGQVETDKFVQFLVLPVILYKSTLFHRENKNAQTKPHFDKKAIKHEAEHLAVWIITNFGERQVDGSYHFVLTKKLYQTELKRFIQEYIETFSDSE
eukprot:248384_1